MERKPTHACLDSSSISDFANNVQSRLQAPSSSCLTEIRTAVEELLQSDLVQGMSPMEHWKWAQTLPRSSEERVVPAVLREATDAALQCTPHELQQQRSSTMIYWAERKEALTAPWAEKLRTLAPHVQAVLGPDQNLLLFEEMLHAAGSPDASLIQHLMEGFAMIGDLPRSNTLPQQAFVKPSESRSSLRRYAKERNKVLLKRVQHSVVQDDEVRREAFRLSCEEVGSGKAKWTSLTKALLEFGLAVKLA